MTIIEFDIESNPLSVFIQREVLRQVEIRATGFALMLNELFLFECYFTQLLLNDINLDRFDGAREKRRLQNIQDELLSTDCIFPCELLSLFEEFSEMLEECATRQCAGPLKVLQHLCHACVCCVTRTTCLVGAAALCALFFFGVSL